MPIPGFHHLADSRFGSLAFSLRMAVAVTLIAYAMAAWFQFHQPVIGAACAAAGLFLAVRGWTELRQLLISRTEDTGMLRALATDLTILVAGGLFLFAGIQYLVFLLSLMHAPQPDFLRLLYGVGALLLASPLGIALHHLKD